MKIIKIPKASTNSNYSLTKKFAEAFDSDEETEKANTIARRFISYRPRSESELRKRLLKTFSSEVTSKSIAQMYRDGLLDDSRFAQMWVDSRQQSRPKSKRTIKQELLSKGISEHTAEQAVSEIHDLENALVCVRKKIRSMNSLEKEEFYKKLEGYLQRRGFSFSVSKTAIQQGWELNQSEINNTIDTINL